MAIPHYSVLANLLQKVRMNRVYDPTVPPERRRFVPGSVSINGMARSSDRSLDVFTDA